MFLDAFFLNSNFIEGWILNYLVIVKSLNSSMDHLFFEHNLFNIIKRK